MIDGSLDRSSCEDAAGGRPDSWPMRGLARGARGIASEQGARARLAQGSIQRQGSSCTHGAAQDRHDGVPML